MDIRLGTGDRLYSSNLKDSRMARLFMVDRSNQMDTYHNLILAELLSRI